MRTRRFSTALALAVFAGATCYAASWQPGVVRDVDENGRKVVVHDDANLRESGGVQQLYVIQTGDELVYAERNEGWRWVHTCEVPRNADVSLEIKGRRLEMRDAAGQTYHFKIVRTAPATQSTLALAEKQSNDPSAMAVSRVIEIR